MDTGINRLRLLFGLGISILIFVLGCSKEESTPPIQNKSIDHTLILPEIKLDSANNVYGYIVDEFNHGVANVVVTDGYSVVTTDSNGVYQFKMNEKARYVHYSSPSEYEIAAESDDLNIPLFYKELEVSDTPQQKSFRLKKRSRVEKSFVLFGLGDPQVGSNSDVDRFIQETLVDVKKELTTISQPAYGISLGDVVSDTPGLLKAMKEKLGSTSMPVFTTIGNHDKFGNNPLPKSSDTFQKVFGPTDYSFNIGDVHFICLDNVMFSDFNKYTAGFSDDQVSWLKKDLSYVSKDKMLIVYFHIPLLNTSFKNRNEFFDLIKDFKEIHLMSGHKHYAQNFITSIAGKDIYEHIHAATCGAWWYSTINRDGTPNGYMMYNIEGSTIKDWIYKSTSLNKNFQFRLHWGDRDYGGQYRYYTYNLPPNTLIANIWNADPAWKVGVYMNGAKLGDMIYNPSLNRDAWSMGYHSGVLNLNPGLVEAVNRHLYSFQVENPNNTLIVVATDRFGRKYEQSYFQIVNDFLTAAGY